MEVGNKKEKARGKEGDPAWPSQEEERCFSFHFNNNSPVKSGEDVFKEISNTLTQPDIESRGSVAGLKTEHWA